MLEPTLNQSLPSQRQRSDAQRPFHSRNVRLHLESMAQLLKRGKTQGKVGLKVEVLVTLAVSPTELDQFFKSVGTQP